MQLDELESVFRSSVKERFQYSPQPLRSVLLIPEEGQEGQELLEQCKGFLAEAIASDSSTEFSVLERENHASVSKILDRVRRNPPDLLLCARQILRQDEALPYSLGTTVDTVTQATDVPVLLLPHRWDEQQARAQEGTRKVMVVTDHLTGDHDLVNWAVQLCVGDGDLYLTHIEDREAMERFLDVCSKIAGLDSEVAAKRVPEKLVEMPTDYIRSISEVLAEEKIQERIHSIVRVGDPVKDYCTLVDEHDVDLLIMNTKDPGQSAMHSLAYALSVEIRSRPLLLL